MMKTHWNKLFCLGILITLLLSLFSTAIPAAAAQPLSGTCGELNWSLGDDFTLTLTGSGAMADYADSADIPWASQAANILKISLPEGLTYIGEKSFYGCKKLNSLQLPSTVKSVGDKAFFNCSSLTSLTLSPALTSLGASALQGCSALETLTLPASLTELGTSVFRNCYSLTAFSVEDTNPAFTEVNGVLFDRARTTLIAYPIGAPATAYGIPEGVTTVAEDAFFNATLLNTVYLPNSVKTVKSYAFTGTSNLSTVYFGGTISEWNALEIPNISEEAVRPDHTHEAEMSCAVPCLCGAKALHELAYSYNNNATCLHDGTANAFCVNGCGYTRTKTAINTKGHLWRNGVCALCEEVCPHEEIANSHCVTCEMRFPTVFKVEDGILYVTYDNQRTWSALGQVQGADGKDGVNGTNGKNGADGKNGTNGIDGIAPMLRINEETGYWEISYNNGDVWTSLKKKATGADGKDGANGQNGQNGADGKNGADGITPLLRVNDETFCWEISYDRGLTWDSLDVNATAGTPTNKIPSKAGVVVALVFACVSIAGTGALLGWLLYERRNRVMVFRDKSDSEPKPKKEPLPKNELTFDQ
ncbi:MAG: hypothetical protein E7620_08105 [Ruminococcaceae bacterium]|nr:hypothetical protein [Oscillospiraceae bacterium]